MDIRNPKGPDNRSLNPKPKVVFKSKPEAFDVKPCTFRTLQIPEARDSARKKVPKNKKKPYTCNL